MSPADWLQWLGFQLSLSVLAVGGAMTLAPELHRYLVAEHGWISEVQFGAAITLAQAAPGPNVMFIAILGWQVGWASVPAAAGPLWQSSLAAMGVLVALGGVLAPSAALTYGASRWVQRHRQRLGVQAFQKGMAPIVVGVMLSTAWLVGQSAGIWAEPRLAALAAVSLLLVWRTQVHLLWLLGAGALAGAMGWV
ncbi:chromate transporter [Ideonella paludis]|uniref:Chromate transporter n=1 Tax=Ideonella paludis TaxID=1233411 RepID=A0ABS5DYF4_9BURK|nr:chromate transporter [Ideonella paludis]MBQ0936089.1 chromate transporter [Ideonella paludis]